MSPLDHIAAGIREFRIQFKAEPIIIRMSSRIHELLLEEGPRKFGKLIPVATAKPGELLGVQFRVEPYCAPPYYTIEGRHPSHILLGVVPDLLPFSEETTAALYRDAGIKP